jgi:sortase A
MGRYDRGVRQMHTRFKTRLRSAIAVVVALTAVTTSSEPARAAAKPGRVVAVLEVPSIKLKTRVREGFSDATLAADPGWWNKQGPIGGANGTSITGHRRSHGAEFRKINLIKRGATVIIKKGGTTFVYRVTGSSIVKPDQVRVLTARKPYELALIACHPERSNKLRIVVRASLVKVVEVGEVAPLK